ncbi:MAG: hypothetical protein P3B98_06330 [Gemmatimonadota bacterium]|nr:hypothetical protein [Gemmatimonadota bacterium]
MLVDLIDRLRCPKPHGDTWLVAAASRTEHRHLVDATLGCHICGAEYTLRAGELWFGDATEETPMPVSEGETLRTAALLGAVERGLYLLDGGWASLAASLGELLDVDLLLADPPAIARGAAAGRGILRGVGDRWPLASASLHGLALSRATEPRLDDAVRVLRAGGRLIAPASAPVPAGIRELTRDGRHWVAEKAAPLVTLARGSR